MLWSATVANQSFHTHLLDVRFRGALRFQNNNNNVHIRNVVTSQALGPGSVLVRGKRVSLGEEECL